MEGQKNTASEAMEAAVAGSYSLDDFDRVVAALGEAVSTWTVKGIADVKLPVLQYGKTS